MKTDDILLELGSHGRYQIRLLSTIVIYCIVNAWGPLTVIFTHYEPQHHCKVLANEDDSISNQSTLYQEKLLNETIPWEQNESGEFVRSSCEMFRPNGSNSTEFLNETIPCDDWTFYVENDGGHTVVSELKLVCNRAWIRPLLVSVMMIGKSIGATTCGFLSDRFGRRPTYLASSLMVIIGTVGVAFARDIYVYCISLTLCGTFSIVQYSSTFLIGTEMVIPKYRNLVGFLVSFGYVIGYATLPLMSYYSSDWHVLLYYISVLSLVFLIGYWLLPESMHWLISKGHLERAKSLITTIAVYNNIDLKADQLLDDSLVENSDASKSEENASILDILKNKVMLTRLLISALVWFTASFVYYAIALNLSVLEGDRYINCLISAVLELPSTALAYFLLDKIGRIKSSTMFFLSGGLACVLAPVLRSYSPIALSIMAIAGKTAMSGIYYIVYIHTAEISPTVVRNLFMGFCLSMGHVGAFLSPYVMFLGDQFKMEMFPYLIMGTTAAISGLVTFVFLPETRGLPLADTIEQASQQKTLLNRRWRKICACFGEKQSQNTKDEEGKNHESTQI